MALPCKGSRPITVGDVNYRWYVRRKPTYMQEGAWSNLSFAVEHAEMSGTILVVVTPHTHPNSWTSHPIVAIRPLDVARSIEAALAQGWQPTQNSKPFSIRAPETQNKAKAVTPSA